MGFQYFFPSYPNTIDRLSFSWEVVMPRSSYICNAKLQCILGSISLSHLSLTVRGFAVFCGPP